MNLDPMKPVGAFIENTIRPLLEELRWFFDECEKKGIILNEDNIKRVIDYVSRAHYRTCLLQCVQTVVVIIILCLTWLLSAKYL